jgi:hypothetical protein
MTTPAPQIDSAKLQHHELLSLQPSRKFITSNKSEGLWHIGKRCDTIGPKSGLILHVHYITLCTGKTLGGPWGQTERKECTESICPRCERIDAKLGLSQH